MKITLKKLKEKITLWEKTETYVKEKLGTEYSIKADCDCCYQIECGTGDQIAWLGSELDYADNDCPECYETLVLVIEGEFCLNCKTVYKEETIEEIKLVKKLVKK